MEHLVTLLLQPPLDIFARGGGGGSFSGGGGSFSDGGGGESGSGGSSIFVVIGYIPMHVLGAFLAKIHKQHTSLATAVVVNCIGWVCATIYAGILLQIFGSLGFFMGILALVGIAAGLYGWFTKLKQSSFVKKALKTAAMKDAAWDETKLVEYTKQTFLTYQNDWSTFNTNSMKTYMTSRYATHAWLLMSVLNQMGRKDEVSHVTLLDTEIISINDADDNAYDSFTVGISASAVDTLTETATGSVLFTDSNPFREYWTFQRNGTTWLLDSIRQASASSRMHNTAIEQFATQQGYYYSEDMGWLFIPKRGQLFDGARFGVSDINNHVVGLYNNAMIVQIYSYRKSAGDDSTVGTKPYVIAQTTVPKQYGQIVVRKKKGFALFSGIKGLEKVETEWTKFNTKYEVYASNYELATSFELLNPTYMEQLEALPFEVNIEVVDSVIYLYVPESTATADVYQTLLDLLYKAFKEMRL